MENQNNTQEDLRHITPMMSLSEFAERMVAFHGEFAEKAESSFLKDLSNQHLNVWQSIKETAERMKEIERQLVMKAYLDGQISAIKVSDDYTEIVDAESYIQKNYKYS